MAENGQETPPNEGAPTGGEGNPPAASAAEPPQGAASGDDEKVTISKSELESLQKSNKDLLSQRDKSDQRLQQTELWIAQQEQEKDIKTFLDDPENKQKFPDVQTSDLLDATKPEDFEELAGQAQSRIDEAVQKRLGDIEKGPPTLSPEDRAAEEKKLKSNPGMNSLEQAINLRS